MALTQAQEDYLIDFIENGIPAEDLGNVNEASSAGVPALTMNFFVQQSNAGDVGQLMPMSSIAQVDKVTGQGFTADNLFMTPKAFGLTVGDTVNNGTLKVATTAKVQAKTDSESALVPSLIDDLFDDNIKKTGSIVDTDVQLDATQTVAIHEATSYSISGGLMRSVSFKFNFTTTVTSKTKQIAFNISALPTYETSFTAYYYDANATAAAATRALGCTWTESGGQAVLSLTTLEDGLNIDTAGDYTIYIHFNYLTS